MLPALSSAKASAKRISCLNSLRQFTIGMNIYVGDSQDKVMPVSTGNSQACSYILDEPGANNAKQLGLNVVSNSPTDWSCRKRTGLPAYEIIKGKNH